MLNALLHDANPWWSKPPNGSFLPLQPFARGRLRDILRTLRPGERAVSLVGPRQVGKTVLLKQTVEVLLGLRRDPTGNESEPLPPQNVTYFSFDDDRITRDVSPREVVDAKPPGVDESLPRYFILDEVSRAHRWDVWLKAAVDRSRHGPGQVDHRFLVSDSASTLLAGGRQESGLGRWDEVRIEPWTLGELLSLDPSETPDEALRRDPTLYERYLARGGFPGHALSPETDDIVQARIRANIVDVAIYKDLDRHLQKADLARRFFVYLAQESGTEQNLSARAADLGVDRRSVENWLALLRRAALVHLLDRQSRSGKASARLKAITRCFVVDHGIVAALSLAEMRPLANARLVETAVFRHLREVALDPRSRLTYFRDDQGESDFVLEVAGMTIAVEATTAAPRRHGKLARFRHAAERIGAQRMVVIHGGLEEGEIDGTILLPLHRFLIEPTLVLGSAEERS